jgi:predicted  nucleic acid-binding Zn-ribbon protein
VSQPSPEVRALVRAADAMTTQLRRIADALSTPTAIIRDGVTTPLDDAPTTPVSLASPCVRCGHARNWHDQNGCTVTTGDRTCGCAQFVAHLEPRGDDEAALRGARRDSLLVLLSRAGRGVLTTDEAALLRQHVEAEMCDADTARAVAAGNKRHVQVMYGELTAAQAAIERVRAVADTLADGTEAGFRAALMVRAALDGTESTEEISTP